MERLRIGVVGCANIAQRSVIPAIKSLEGFRLVAVASRTISKAEECGRRFECDSVHGYQALLDREDIDAIYLPLPTGLHEEWILKAIEARKHILAEKSLALTAISAEKMVLAAQRAGVLLMENFMFPYHSQHAWVRRQIEESAIGEIRQFRAAFGFSGFPKGNFRNDPALGGGALLDAAGYTVKAAQLFLGSGLTVQSASLAVHPEFGVDYFGSAQLTNEKGLTAQVAFGFDNFYQCNYEVWGSKGKLSVLRAFTPPHDFAPTVVLEQQNHREEFRLPADDHFKNVLVEFHRAIEALDHETHHVACLQQAILLQEIRDLAGFTTYAGETTQF